MAVQMQEGNMPHIYWIDLKGDGVYTECAVMKRDGLGNVMFFPLKALDNIDKKRLARILTNRNAVHFELWDLMSNITLNNGVNALTYFHQLVEMITPSGRVMKPEAGVIGIETTGVIDTRNADQRKDYERYAQDATKIATEAAKAATEAALRGYDDHQQRAAAPQQPQATAPKKPTPSRSGGGTTKKS